MQNVEKEQELALTSRRNLVYHQGKAVSSVSNYLITTVLLKEIYYTTPGL